MSLLEGRLVTNDLSLVPGLAMKDGCNGFHDGLPSTGTKTRYLLDAVVHEWTTVDLSFLAVQKYARY